MGANIFGYSYVLGLDCTGYLPFGAANKYIQEVIRTKKTLSFEQGFIYFNPVKINLQPSLFLSPLLSLLQRCYLVQECSE